MARPKKAEEDKRQQKTITLEKPVIAELRLLSKLSGVAESIIINEVLSSLFYGLPLPLYTSSYKPAKMGAV